MATRVHGVNKGSVTRPNPSPNPNPNPNPDPNPNPNSNPDPDPDPDPDPTSSTARCATVCNSSSRSTWPRSYPTSPPRRARICRGRIAAAMAAAPLARRHRPRPRTPTALPRRLLRGEGGATRHSGHTATAAHIRHTIGIGWVGVGKIKLVLRAGLQQA